MDNKTLYSKLLKDPTAQLIVAIEELAELQKELTKTLRGHQNTQHILEEIVDVEIMLEQLKLLFSLSQEDINIQKELKLKRVEQRLKQNNL